MLMRIVAVLILLGTSATVRADDPGPCAIFFHGKYLESGFAFQRRVVDQYEIAISAALEKYLSRGDFYEYDVPKGFRRREGIAYYWTSPERFRSVRDLAVVRFVTVPDRRAFNQLVANTARRRGADAKIIGSDKDNRRRVETPRISLRLRYDQRGGIAAIGSSAKVDDVDLSKLAAAAKRSAGRHSHYEIVLSAIPRENREVVFKELQRQVNPQLQQRDNEPLGQFSSRRLLGDGWLQFVDWMLSDVISIRWWWTLPDESNKVRAGASVRFVKDSKFDRAVARLANPRPRLEIVEDVLVGASACMRLTAGQLAVARALAERLPEEWAELVGPLLTTDLEIHGAVTSDGDQGPKLSIALPRASRSTGASEVPSIELPHFGELLGSVADIAIEGQSVLAATLAKSESEVPAGKVFGRASRKPFPLIKVSGDLSAWSGSAPESDMGLLLAALERMYDEEVHRNVLATSHVPAAMVRIRRELDDSDFRTLGPYIKTKGRWDASLEVRRRRSSLVLDVTAGGDLYRWLVARWRIARIRAGQKR